MNNLSTYLCTCSEYIHCTDCSENNVNIRKSSAFYYSPFNRQNKLTNYFTITVTELQLQKNKNKNLIMCTV